MSPEQIIGSKDISSASDIFSFGIIFYSMVTGTFPFKDNDESVVYSIREDLPPILNKLILALLPKDPLPYSSTKNYKK